MLAVNFAGHMVNPARLVVTKQTIERPGSAHLIVLPGGDVAFGHALIFHAELWRQPLAQFLNKME